MRYAVIVMSVALLCMVGQGFPVLGRDDGKRLAQDGPGAAHPGFRERALQERRYLACYEAHKRKCYDEYCEAVKWCENNWEKCLPLINGTGLHVGTYGKQVLEECKAELRKRCRQDAGM
jgi:hypothetical protein